MSFLQNLNVFIAKVYNGLHPKLKIALMVFVSVLVSGAINLFIRDITAYKSDVSSDYWKLLLDALIPLLAAIVNIVQQYAVDSGTRLLASSGDYTTIRKLETSIQTKQEIINTAK